MRFPFQTCFRSRRSYDPFKGGSSRPTSSPAIPGNSEQMSVDLCLQVIDFGAATEVGEPRNFADGWEMDYSVGSINTAPTSRYDAGHIVVISTSKTVQYVVLKNTPYEPNPKLI